MDKPLSFNFKKLPSASITRRRAMDASQIGNRSHFYDASPLKKSEFSLWGPSDRV